MPVLEIPGDDALVTVSTVDRHGRGALIWQLGIAALAFGPLEQLCNSPRVFIGGSHFGW